MSYARSLVERVRRAPSVSRLLAAVIAVGLTGVVPHGATPALAQANKPAAAKKAAGAKKGAKKQNVAWVKLCEKVQVNKKGDKKQICITHHERLDGNTGMVLVSAAVRKVEGAKRESFMVMVPLGMALPPGVLVKIDDDKKPIKLKYAICHAGGCTAETPLTPEILAKLRKGKQMMVAAFNVLGQPIGFPVPLTGFAKAYAGKPVDMKKYAEARRKLMTFIRKRQIARMQKAREEAAKKKEGQKKK